MKKNKVVFIIALLLISTTFISTVNAKAVEENKKKDWFNDLQNLKDAMKKLNNLMKQDILAGNVSIGEFFEIPFDWLLISVEIMEMCYHLFGHWIIGQLIGAICIYIAMFVPIRFVTMGEVIDYYTNDFIDDFAVSLEDCYDNFGVFGCFIVICCIAPFILPIIMIFFAFDIRSTHMGYYGDCVNYALLYAS